ncbi:MAG: nucleotidyltransferase family protein [Candidatus Niyogibacteria bacterium]|nr:nucleotidyltransferase family protein [Candidatus Niyogibacteria bacterium]
MSKDDVQKIINDIMPALRDKYHIKNLGIFGSVARGEDTPASDVDILVEFETPPSFFEFIKLENYLSEQLGKKVDLVTKKALKPAIREEIMREILYV